MAKYLCVNSNFGDRDEVYDSVEAFQRAYRERTGEDLVLFEKEGTGEYFTPYDDDAWPEDDRWIRVLEPEEPLHWTYLWTTDTWGDGWSEEQLAQLAEAFEDALEDEESEPIWVHRVQPGEISGLYYGERGQPGFKIAGPSSSAVPEHIDERISRAWERCQQVVQYRGCYEVSDGECSRTIRADSASAASHEYLTYWEQGPEATATHVEVTVTPYEDGELQRHLSETRRVRVRNAE